MTQSATRVGSCSCGSSDRFSAFAPDDAEGLVAITFSDVPKQRPPVEELPNNSFVRRGPLFDFDHDLFAKNLRVSRGVAGGPSGTTSCDPCWTVKSTLCGTQRSSFGGSDRPRRTWHQSSGHFSWQSLSGRSWMPPRPPTSCCFSGSQQCRDLQSAWLLLFCASSWVTSGCVILTTPKLSHDSMTFTFGSVSLPCWGNGMTLSHRIRGSLPLWCTSFHTCCLLGQLGRLLAYYQPTSRRHCPNHVGRPRKPSNLRCSHPGCRVVSSWPK